MPLEFVILAGAKRMEQNATETEFRDLILHSVPVLLAVLASTHLPELFADWSFRNSSKDTESRQMAVPTNRVIKKRRSTTGALLFRVFYFRNWKNRIGASLIGNVTVFTPLLSTGVLVTEVQLS